MSRERETIKQILPQTLIFLGIFIFLISLLGASLIFWPIIKAEISYKTLIPNIKATIVNPSENKTPSPNEIIPVDNNFTIIIPKIGANTKVIKDVDPQNSKIYQQALTKGVAHAKGTSLPGTGSNIFIFAHSAGSILEASQYNAVFYLLNKLVKGDRIVLYYNGTSYEYLVSAVKIVEANKIEYLGKTNKEVLTLMTCWPPATTLKRLIVEAYPKTD